MSIASRIFFGQLLVGFSLAAGALASSNTLGDGNGLARRVADLELTWRDGSGDRQYEYYVAASVIARDLFRYEQADANSAALVLLDNLMAKRGEPRPEVSDSDFEVGAADLIAIGDVARYLLAPGNAASGPQEPKVRPFSRVLGLVRSEILPGYTPKPATMNVPPPAGKGGMTFTGMDPNAIADPVAREKYKAEIRQNRLNNLSNKRQRQRQLQRMETEFAKPVVAYLSRVALLKPDARNLIREAVGFTTGSAVVLEPRP